MAGSINFSQVIENKNPAELQTFLEGGGKDHPLSAIARAYIGEFDNAHFREAVDTTPMPNFVKRIVYDLVKPSTTEADWGENHLAEHALVTVQAAQLTLNPLSLLEHAIDHKWDLDSLRKIIDQIEEKAPGKKELILNLFWRACGTPDEGDPNWSWNHLADDDEKLRLLKFSLSGVFITETAMTLSDVFAEKEPAAEGAGKGATSGASEAAIEGASRAFDRRPECTRFSDLLATKDPGDLESFARGAGKTHPLLKVITAAVEKRDNAGFLDAVNASPMPGTVKKIVYDLVQPEDAGWDWGDKHLADHADITLRASQMVLNPFALMEHALEHNWDIGHLRMILSYIDEIKPGYKETVLKEYWVACGSPEGDPNWSWNHLADNDGDKRAILTLLLRIQAGITKDDESLASAYDKILQQAERNLLEKTKKTPGDSVFRLNSISPNERVTKPCHALGGDSNPYMFGYYRVAADGNTIYPGTTYLSVRLPDSAKEKLPESVRKVLQEQGVSSTRIYAEFGRPGSGPNNEINFYSHTLIHADITHDTKTYPLMGVFETTGIEELADDYYRDAGYQREVHGPMPFNHLERREVFTHDVGIGTLVRSPRNAHFKYLDTAERAEFYSVVIKDEGDGSCHRKVAYVCQHRFDPADFPMGAQKLSELKGSSFLPSLVEELLPDAVLEGVEG